MSHDVQLRPATQDDLPVLGEIQSDPTANEMAAIVCQKPAAVVEFWQTRMTDPNTVVRAVIAYDEIVGSVASFESDGMRTVGYWIAKSHWGKGIASRALELFLGELAIRPLYARVASTNLASIRVLQKSGFTVEEYRHSQATDRYLECEEALLVLR